jgi:anaerobic magnesium-protoporphyrin IX monomethyl ester cyclase
MVKEEGVDAVFRGEGEEAFAEFLQAFPHREKLYRLRNCWVKDMADPARIHENPLRPLIDDLDLIPFPDRALISRYLRKPLGFHTFMSSRGCPYQCTYCFNAAYRALYQGLGKTLRKRSVGNLIEEISRVKSEFPLQHVSFQDDEFCGSLEWLKEFSAEYRRVIGVPFSCNFRPNLVTGEKVALLKEAGLSSASMAFEAGDPRVRNEILKRNLSQETMLHAAHTITSAGVFLTIQNILGIPGGSLEADLKTLDLNIAARPGYAWVSICAPYPGTELGTYARDRGYFDGTLDSLTPTYHFRSSLTIKHKREVENLHKLFAIVVEYPWLKPLARQLIRLPLTGVYNLARKFFKGWIYYRKNRFKMRFSLAEKLKYGLKFLTETGG